MYTKAYENYESVWIFIFIASMTAAVIVVLKILILKNVIANNHKLKIILMLWPITDKLIKILYCFVYIH